MSEPVLSSPPEVAGTVFGDRLDKAVAYHELLATDGSTRGFIGPREVPRLWQRHLLNCAVIGEAFEAEAAIVDIGSGAGLPGIPLAIAREDLRITLVEPLLKRATFLGEVTQALGLSNVTVIRGRAEEPALRRRLAADFVTSRAVAPLGKLAGWSLPLAKIGGSMVAMKGSSVHEELQRDAELIRAAGGGEATVFTVGDTLLEEPTTLIRIPRVS
ncbi:16S rRNA (guanine(527)-N(7))-methyltransferase RsmG [Corynebacterium uterequi]|uniref:Ribosomal RNA small subunit methyltransferase G n=1 Tax=Corynebacterium uterequi TaxID=1072256 RepID=A0A0G3HM67_9CORY|nr:16S rRNA (guanine(527)-N(7))-methyltransferase RsmG [Corynebacterium uterequi]AKK12192.1 16S rRNA (guanine(527)-N(7))-methyltransferase RsmG [Corynebacterium uterequi]